MGNEAGTLGHRTSLEKTDVTFDVNAYITCQKSFKKTLSTTENGRFENQ